MCYTHLMRVNFTVPLRTKFMALLDKHHSELHGTFRIKGGVIREGQGCADCFISDITIHSILYMYV